MIKSLIGILYNEPAPLGHPLWESSKDVRDQVVAIETALQELSRPCIRIPFAGDIKKLLNLLERKSVTMAFNLCESVNENPRLIGHPAAVLELLGIPFSGSPALSLMLTTDKLLSKQLLKANGVNTPEFALYDGFFYDEPLALRFPVIAKPRFEDASIGIDQESIFTDNHSLRQGVEELYNLHGSLIIEEFISGREFNLSIFGYPEPKVFKAAEIDFSEFPSELYQIVGYRAKWDPTAFEYHHSPRRFPDNLSNLLAADLHKTALCCYKLFQLRDYGRIDFRVDQYNNVYVLEANANPCLSPDAGFTAAAYNEGLSFTAITAEFIKFLEMRTV